MTPVKAIHIQPFAPSQLLLLLNGGSRPLADIQRNKGKWPILGLNDHLPVEN
jgi:hypothetical protein